MRTLVSVLFLMPAIHSANSSGVSDSTYLGAASVSALSRPEEGIKLSDLAHRRGVSSLCFLHRLLNKAAPKAVLDLAPSIAPPPTRFTRNLARAPSYLVSATVRRTDPAYWANSCINIATTAYNSLSSGCKTETNLQLFKKQANYSTLPPPFAVQEFSKKK